MHRPALAPEASPARPGAGRTQGTAAKSALKLPLVDGGYKIINAEMTVAVRGAQNVARMADRADAIALGNGGGFDSDDRTSGPHATATLQLRVPPEQVAATMTALSKLGIEKSRQSTTTDVTRKVADVHARVLNAYAALAEFRALVHRAKKISDIIALETELNERQADLESMRAQYRALTAEADMATITLSLVTAAKHHAPPPKKHEKHRGGFIGGLQRGWDGFATAAVWVAAAIGTLLPFLVLLLVVALGARLLWPRLQRRQATPSPTPSE